MHACRMHVREYTGSLLHPTLKLSQRCLNELPYLILQFYVLALKEVYIVLRGNYCTFKINILIETPSSLTEQREIFHQSNVRSLNMSPSSVCKRLMITRHFQGDWEGWSHRMTNYPLFFLNDNTLFMSKRYQTHELPGWLFNRLWI